MNNKQPLVDIIICTKNNKKIISNCLDSVRNQTYKNWNCFVADDNSTDGGCKFIEKKYSFVKVLKLGGKGPAYNRNVAIKSGSGKYIVTLDSDAVITKNWLGEMVKLMENYPKIGIGGGKTLFHDNHNSINSAGGRMPLVGVFYHRGTGQDKNKEEYNQITRTLYLCSASMIIRRDIFKTIGYFDPDYIYGYEDVDICWRANIAGFNVVYNPYAESYH